MYVAFGLDIECLNDYRAARKIVDLAYVLRYPHEVYDVLDALARFYEDRLGKQKRREAVENRYVHAWLVD